MDASRLLVACVLVAALTVACTGTAAPTPTLLPYPDDMDVVAVYEAVIAEINDARGEQGRDPVAWDETLLDLAEGQAMAIVGGRADFDVLDDSAANEMGVPLGQLRACLPAMLPTGDIAPVAVARWLGDPSLRDMVLGDWTRVGVGLDWGCPKADARGVVLVVFLAGAEGGKVVSTF